MTPVVELQHVSKSFDGPDGRNTVLRDLEISILPGQKTSLVGPSGCGKSTLLALIAGLLRPDSGTVLIDGIAMSDLDEPARARLRVDRIGIALQADNLIPFLTAAENVELALAFGPFGRGGKARKRSLSLLERLGVDSRADHLPRQLSGGEAQRVALAVSMSNEPSLLLADEVVAQLDGGTAARVIDEVLATDLAVLYVTHDIDLADLVDHRYELDEFGIRPR